MYFCTIKRNTNYGINLSGGKRVGMINNCGFSDNTTAATNALDNAVIAGTVNYGAGVTPWTAPTTGNFSINLAAAINAGRGTFTETQASYTGTVGYPDIGAAQHLESAGAAGGVRVAGKGGLAAGA